MVNSGSFDSDGNRNAKAGFIQAHESSERSQSPEHLAVGDAPYCKNGFSQTADSDLLSVGDAIEPTPTKTEFNSSMSIEGCPPPHDDGSVEREPGLKPKSLSSEEQTEKATLYCSVPLEKLEGVLTTYGGGTAGACKPSEIDKVKLNSRKYLCLYCERTFVNVNLRQKHVERCHSDKYTRRVSSRRVRNQVTNTPCFYCDKLASSEYTLRDLFEHLVSDHSNKYFACLCCEIRFLNNSLLQEHNASKHATIPHATALRPVSVLLEKGTISPSLLKKNDSASSSSSFADKDDADSLSGSESETSGAYINIKREESSEDDEDVPVKVTRSKVKNKNSQQDKSSTVNNSRNKKNNSNLRQLPSRKLRVRASKISQNRNRRESQKKKRPKNGDKKTVAAVKTETTTAKAAEKPTKINPGCINPYPEFDSFYRVKKITDHSIDNLKISSLKFDDVFDKAFFNRIKCNIQENLLHHIDGKLFNNEESESRISNFEKISSATPEVQNTNQENFGCDVSLNAVTPVATFLSSSNFGEDLESQIEYGSKPSKKKTPTTRPDEVHYKYFTRRKYQASIMEQKENRDLSKLDMWTQLVIKNRQQKMADDKKSVKEMLEYTTGEEYKSQLKRQELDKILDRRGPFEDLREEATKKAALDKLSLSLDETVSEEGFDEVNLILNDIINNVFETVREDPQCVNNESIQEDCQDNSKFRRQSDELPEIPSYLQLRRSSSSPEGEIDKSDKIALICSSQETEYYELPGNTVRQKNETVELTGEWARSRIYICAACGTKVSNMKQLIDHKNFYHQYVWTQHYEFVGNQSELYRHLSIPGLGKVGIVEDSTRCTVWQRSLARSCTKCNKRCNALAELHRHMLECGGDWSWMLARKKCKYRPYGAKSRRKRRGLVKRMHIQKPSRTEKSTLTNKKHFEGPRQRPSDADTIQRMLANLPAKRATRKIMSLKDGFQRNSQPHMGVKIKPQSKMKCGKMIVRNSNVKNIKNTTESNAKSNNSSNSSMSSHSQKNNRNIRRSMRSINKVFSCRILDTSSAMMVKRKIKAACNNRRITRQIAKVAAVEETSENIDDSFVDIEDETEIEIKKTKPVARKSSPKSKKESKSPILEVVEKKVEVKTKKNSPKQQKTDKDNDDTPNIKNSNNVPLTNTMNKKSNIKNFFPVKKNQTTSPPPVDATKLEKVDDPKLDEANPEVEIKVKSKTEQNSEKKPVGKNQTLSKIVRSLSLRKRKLKEGENSESVKEKEESEKANKKRRIRQSFRNVVNKVKRLQAEKAATPTNKSQEDSINKTLTGSFLEKGSPGNAGYSPPAERIVIPSQEKSESTADIVLAPIVINSNSDPSTSADIPPVPDTVFNLQSNNEKNLQAKGERDFETENVSDSISETTPDLTLEIKPLKPSIPAAPGNKGKMRKPAKRLNDCIAMLTSKLQQQEQEKPSPINTSTYPETSVVSTSDNLDLKPIEIIFNNYNDLKSKTHQASLDENGEKEEECVALDLSIKSSRRLDNHDSDQKLQLASNSTSTATSLSNSERESNKGLNVPLLPVETEKKWSTIDDIIKKVVENNCNNNTKVIDSEIRLDNQLIVPQKPFKSQSWNCIDDIIEHVVSGKYLLNSIAKKSEHLNAIASNFNYSADRSVVNQNKPCEYDQKTRHYEGISHNLSLLTECTSVDGHSLKTTTNIYPKILTDTGNQISKRIRKSLIELNINPEVPILPLNQVVVKNAEGSNPIVNEKSACLETNLDDLLNVREVEDVPNETKNVDIFPEENEPLQLEIKPVVTPLLQSHQSDTEDELPLSILKEVSEEKRIGTPSVASNSNDSFLDELLDQNGFNTDLLKPVEKTRHPKKKNIFKRWVDNKLSRKIKRKVTKMKPVEGKKAIDKPVDGKKAIAKTFDGKKTIAKPFDDKESIDVPVDGKKAIDMPVDGKKAIDKKVDGKKPIAKPFEDKEAIDMPVDGKKAIAKPVDSKKAIAKPVDGKKTIAKTFDGKKAIAKPFDDKEAIEKIMDSIESVVIKFNMLDENAQSESDTFNQNNLELVAIEAEKIEDRDRSIEDETNLPELESESITNKVPSELSVSKSLRKIRKNKSHTTSSSEIDIQSLPENKCDEPRTINPIEKIEAVAAVKNKREGKKKSAQNDVPEAPPNLESDIKNYIATEIDQIVSQSDQIDIDMTKNKQEIVSKSLSTDEIDSKEQIHNDTSINLDSIPVAEIDELTIEQSETPTKNKKVSKRSVSAGKKKKSFQSVDLESKDQIFDTLVNLESNVEASHSVPETDELPSTDQIVTPTKNKREGKRKAVTAGNKKKSLQESDTSLNLESNFEDYHADVVIDDPSNIVKNEIPAKNKKDVKKRSISAGNKKKSSQLVDFEAKEQIPDNFVDLETTAAVEISKLPDEPNEIPVKEESKSRSVAGNKKNALQTVDVDREPKNQITDTSINSESNTEDYHPVVEIDALPGTPAKNKKGRKRKTVIAGNKKKSPLESKSHISDISVNLESNVEDYHGDASIDELSDIIQNKTPAKNKKETKKRSLSAGNKKKSLQMTDIDSKEQIPGEINLESNVKDLPDSEIDDLPNVDQSDDLTKNTLGTFGSEIDGLSSINQSVETSPAKNKKEIKQRSIGNLKKSLEQVDLEPKEQIPDTSVNLEDYYNADTESEEKLDQTRTITITKNKNSKRRPISSGNRKKIDLPDFEELTSLNLEADVMDYHADIEAEEKLPSVEQVEIPVITKNKKQGKKKPVTRKKKSVKPIDLAVSTQKNDTKDEQVGLEIEEKANAERDSGSEKSTMNDLSDKNSVEKICEKTTEDSSLFCSDIDPIIDPSFGVESFQENNQSEDFIPETKNEDELIKLQAFGYINCNKNGKVSKRKSKKKKNWTKINKSLQAKSFLIKSSEPISLIEELPIFEVPKIKINLKNLPRVSLDNDFVTKNDPIKDLEDIIITPQSSESSFISLDTTFENAVTATVIEDLVVKESNDFEDQLTPTDTEVRPLQINEIIKPVVKTPIKLHRRRKKAKSYNWTKKAPRKKITVFRNEENSEALETDVEPLQMKVADEETSIDETVQESIPESDGHFENKSDTSNDQVITEVSARVPDILSTPPILCDIEDKNNTEDKDMTKSNNDPISEEFFLAPKKSPVSKRSIKKRTSSSSRKQKIALDIVSSSETETDGGDNETSLQSDNNDDVEVATNKSSPFQEESIDVLLDNSNLIRDEDKKEEPISNLRNRNLTKTRKARNKKTETEKSYVSCNETTEIISGENYSSSFKPDENDSNKITDIHLPGDSCSEIENSIIDKITNKPTTTKRKAAKKRGKKSLAALKNELIEEVKVDSQTNDLTSKICDTFSEISATTESILPMQQNELSKVKENVEMVTENVEKFKSPKRKSRKPTKSTVLSEEIIYISKNVEATVSYSKSEEKLIPSAAIQDSNRKTIFDHDFDIEDFREIKTTEIREKIVPTEEEEECETDKKSQYDDINKSSIYNFSEEDDFIIDMPRKTNKSNGRFTHITDQRSDTQDPDPVFPLPQKKGRKKIKSFANKTEAASEADTEMDSTSDVSFDQDRKFRRRPRTSNQSLETFTSSENDSSFEQTKVHARKLRNRHHVKPKYFPPETSTDNESSTEIFVDSKDNTESVLKLRIRKKTKNTLPKRTASEESFKELLDLKKKSETSEKELLDESKLSNLPNEVDYDTTTGDESETRSKLRTRKTKPKNVPIEKQCESEDDQTKLNPIFLNDESGCHLEENIGESAIEETVAEKCEDIGEIIAPIRSKSKQRKRSRLETDTTDSNKTDDAEELEDEQLDEENSSHVEEDQLISIDISQKQAEVLVLVKEPKSNKRNKSKRKKKLQKVSSSSFVPEENEDNDSLDNLSSLPPLETRDDFNPESIPELTTSKTFSNDDDVFIKPKTKVRASKNRKKLLDLPIETSFDNVKNNLDQTNNEENGGNPNRRVGRKAKAKALEHILDEALAELSERNTLGNTFPDNKISGILSYALEEKLLEADSDSDSSNYNNKSFPSSIDKADASSSSKYDSWDDLNNMDQNLARGKDIEQNVSEQITNDDSKEEVESSLITTAGQEVRRSRRNTRKVIYNENDIIDELLNDSPPSQMQQKTEDDAKLISPPLPSPQPQIPSLLFGSSEKNTSNNKENALKETPDKGKIFDFVNGLLVENKNPDVNRFENKLPNKKEERKLNSDELFDLLKQSTPEIKLPKPKLLPSPSNNFDDISDFSSDSNHFDNVFENILEIQDNLVDPSKQQEESDADDESRNESIDISLENKVGEASKEIDISHAVDDLFDDDTSGKLENSNSVKCNKRHKKGKIKTKINDSKRNDYNTHHYCEICNKSFRRADNLVKHKMTLTHISKLSEIEAQEEQRKSDATPIENETSEINDELTEPAKESNWSNSPSDSSDIQNSLEESPLVTSTFASNPGLKLADIISDVLSKPVINSSAENHNFSDILQNASDNNRRYKSLGERKSFDSENNFMSFESNSHNITLEPNFFKPDLSDNTEKVEKQITLLQNMIEKNGNTLNYMDDVSNTSMRDSARSSPALSIASSRQDDSNNLTFSSSNVTNSLKQSNDNSFIKPSHYEEVSEESTNVRHFDDKKSRKVLNRDEELFLECCSLLKSGSEVSNYSKRSQRFLAALKHNPKLVDEPEWMESKHLTQKRSYDDQFSDNSRIPTPLGESYVDEMSNSNTISSNWEVRKKYENDTPESDGIEKACLENRSFIFKENSLDDQSSTDDVILGTGVAPNNAKEFDEGTNLNEENEVPEIDKHDKETSSSDNIRFLSKGAKKEFEGLKVSIPTDDLNMTEVLNCSPATKTERATNKKLFEAKGGFKKSILKPSQLGKNKKKSKSVKNKSLKGKFSFKFAHRDFSQKILKRKRKISLSADGNSKSLDSAVDVYDFEETQDNSDVFTKPDFRSFRAKKPDKDSKTSEMGLESDNDSSTSLNLETKSVSSVSSLSNTSVKNPKTQQVTKKKCMIMGRIFKNAVKSKAEEEIREIPVLDNKELVKNYVMNCSEVDSKENNKHSEVKTNVEKDALLKKKSDGKLQNKKRTKTRKRSRVNSDSTDDEFSLNKNKKRTYKKNAKPEDNCINLEQELKECIGVASRKSQRKCTSGKQNVLVEYWSSDDSSFEALLESQIIQSSNPAKIQPDKQEKYNPPEVDNNSNTNVTGAGICSSSYNTCTGTGTSTSTSMSTSTSTGTSTKASTPTTTITSSKSLEDILDRISEFKLPEVPHEKSTPLPAQLTLTFDSVRSEPGKVKRESKQKSSKKSKPTERKLVKKPKLELENPSQETLASTRSKRVAVDPLYHWSSSSEDESQDLVAVKPVREELDDEENEDRPVQHGWIVGDSPKKLVTMLAQAKGKKTDSDCVKEQGKKRTANSGS